MKLESIQIKDFKRFTKLSITGLPSTAKLVLLTGPNGSGKTSLFEAFNYWVNCQPGQFRGSLDLEYHTRPTHENTKTKDWDEILKGIELKFHGIDNIDGDQIRKRKAFYIRSAYRHEADFTINELKKIDDILNDSKRPPRLIQQEERVSENYQRMVAETVAAIYSDDPITQQKKVKELADELIGEVRKAVKNVFGDLELKGPGDPLTNGTFRFKKGAASGFHYKNLSGGEKAAFDLLLDFIVKRKAFDDTVYCIDEPELHMHTRLQAKLLEVMFDLIPENCQLWLSTHSIGMARKASELHAANSGKVAFVDFHDHNFDKQTSIQPTHPDRIFWKKIFHTAFDDLAELVVPDCVVFCEGKRIGQSSRRPSFDAEVYNTIFERKYPMVEFIPLGGTNEVGNDGKTFSLILSKLAPGIKCWKVFDRDDRSNSEIQELKKDRIHVLDRRDLESYLWDDEILQALCGRNEKPEKLEELKTERNQALTDLRQQGKPADDIKAISGRLYNKCKQILELTGCGNDAEAFARITLAPLVKPETGVYRKLEAIVMEPLLNNQSNSPSQTTRN